MTIALEHINISVQAPQTLAKRLCKLFNWKIRWEGESISSGYTVHVGGEDNYLALYRPPEFTHAASPRHVAENALNHIGLTTDDLAALREKVLDEGLEIHGENEVTPGKRIYFMLEGIELEVVEY